MQFLCTNCLCYIVSHCVRSVTEKLLFGKRSSLWFSHISHTSDHPFIQNISFDYNVAFARKRLQNLQTNILFSYRFLRALLEPWSANNINFRRKFNVMIYWFIFLHCISRISITDDRFILSRISVIWANEEANVEIMY